MKYGLPDNQLERIVGILAREPLVARILLYGSRAKGNFRAGSDIDLCIEADGLDNAKLLRLENELDDLLLPWKIDLAIKQHIDNPELLAHIGRVGEILYQRDCAG